MECCNELVTNPAFIYLYRQHLKVCIPLLPQIIGIVADYLIYRAPTPVVVIHTLNGRSFCGVFTSRQKARGALNNLASTRWHLYEDYLEATQDEIQPEIQTPQEFFRGYEDNHQIHDLPSEIDINKPLFVLVNLNGALCGNYVTNWLTNSLEEFNKKSSFCIRPDDWKEQCTATIDKPL